MCTLIQWRLCLIFQCTERPTASLCLTQTCTCTHTPKNNNNKQTNKHIHTLVCRQTDRQAGRQADKNPILIIVLTTFSAVDVLSRLAFRDVGCILHTQKVNVVFFLVTGNKNSNQSGYFYSKEQITVYGW